MESKTFNCEFCGRELKANCWGEYSCNDCGIFYGKPGTRKLKIDDPELAQEQPIPDKNVMHHMAICTEMNALYARKNRDYGDSFHISFQEEGMAMARIRLGDKLNRFKTLTKNKEQQVQDESIRDTLIDLANYAIMTIMEMDREEG